jgi:hypothetical protein
MASLAARALRALKGILGKCCALPPMFLMPNDVTGGLQFIAAEPRAASAGSTPSGYSSDILINRNSPYADRPVGG